MEKWYLAKYALVTAAVCALVFVAGPTLFGNHSVYAQDRTWGVQKAAPGVVNEPRTEPAERWGASPRVQEKAFSVRTELRHRIEIDGMKLPNVRLTSPLVGHVDAVQYSEASSTLVRTLPGLVSFDKFSISGLLPVPGDAIAWFDHIRQGQAERRSGVIVLMDRQGADVQRYLFRDAWPTDLAVDLGTGAWTLTIICEGIKFEAP